jgi:GT2 family glycosyltransferase
MKVALFTLTKDRLEYTKQTFKSLKKKTHIPYDHFVLDQGSKDGTVDWLNSFTHKLGKIYVYPLNMNIGINRGVNYIVDKIGDRYDIIVKIDNDVEIETDGWLEKMIKVLAPKSVISPYVKGLIDNRGGVNRYSHIKELNIGLTPFIGGICMIGHRKAWNEDSGGWEYPRPKHAGGDKAFCQKLELAGYKFGYVENVIIKHIESTTGQHERYPDYFKLRKEERTKIF